MTTNGGSTVFRNYPDVAMMADNNEIFFDGASTDFVGTSVAAPLFAGFIALANQKSLQTGAGPAGFVNPTIYAIGLTRGSATDLYSTSFNNISDGATNFDGFGHGFTSVAGYNLTTGWGSPKTGLIDQLSSPTPLSPNTALGNIGITITTGPQGLQEDNDTGCLFGIDANVAQAVILFVQRQQLHRPLGKLI